MPVTTGSVEIDVHATELATAYSTGAVGIGVSRTSISSESLSVSLGISAGQTSFMTYSSAALGIAAAAANLCLSNLTTGAIGIGLDESILLPENFQPVVFHQYAMDPAAVVLGQNQSGLVNGNTYVTSGKNVIPAGWLMDPAYIIYYLPASLPYFPVSISDEAH